MARTVLTSATQEVVIGFDQPFVMIGERINPTGRPLFSKELKEGNYWRVKKEALAQVEAGAQILDVNVGVPLADEPEIMSEVIPLIQGLTDVPLCIDSSIIEALESGLAAYKGNMIALLWRFLMMTPVFPKTRMYVSRSLNALLTGRRIMVSSQRILLSTLWLCPLEPLTVPVRMSLRCCTVCGMN